MLICRSHKNILLPWFWLRSHPILCKLPDRSTPAARRNRYHVIVIILYANVAYEMMMLMMMMRQQKSQMVPVKLIKNKNDIFYVSSLKISQFHRRRRADMSRGIALTMYSVTSCWRHRPSITSQWRNNGRSARRNMCGWFVKKTLNRDTSRKLDSKLTSEAWHRSRT